MHDASAHGRRRANVAMGSSASAANLGSRTESGRAASGPVPEFQLTRFVSPFE
jgi:hypothetical protein